MEKLYRNEEKEECDGVESLNFSPKAGQVFGASKL
jgi:hypothetical protein